MDEEVVGVGEDDAGGKVVPFLLKLAVLFGADFPVGGGAGLGDELIDDDIAEVRDVQAGGAPLGAVPAEIGVRVGPLVPASDGQNQRNYYATAVLAPPIRPVVNELKSINIVT